MATGAASVAYLILAVFFAGVAVGVVTMVAVVVRREDRLYSLARVTPDELACGLRRLTRLGRGELLRPRRIDS
jgi:hypothetical protein